MSSTKNTHSKPLKSRLAPKAMTKMPVISPAPTKDMEDVARPQTLKVKKPIDLDIAEDAIPALEEKAVDEESLAAEDAEDAATEEISLDDEELNPFGDKWEQ